MQAWLGILSVPRGTAYSRAMESLPCLRKSSLRASPSRDWTVRSCMTPSRRSWRWTAGEKWPAMVTVPGPRFLEGRGGGGCLASRLAAGVSLRHGKAQGQAVREGGTRPDAGRRDLGPVVAHCGLGEIRRPAARRDLVQNDREGKGGESAEAGGGKGSIEAGGGTAPTNGERPRLSPQRAALAWGSRSTRAAEPPAPSKSAATWTARVVLPVPPFWANSAIVYIASATLRSLSRIRPPG